MLKYTLCLNKVWCQTFCNNFTNFTYLFTELPSSTYTSHKVTTLKNCWTFGMALNRVQLIRN